MITKGQKINDRYEIIKSIGEGGMANVYLADDVILDRKVAIKILRGDLAGDEKFIRRFNREAVSASQLSHPNIVEIYDVGEDGDIHYIVMEYIKGKTLKQLIKKRGHLTIGEAIDIMSQLADGVAQAHKSYIIHRDLKPQNIMIQEDGQIKITDFGIAMALNSSHLTQTNSVMGSVHYLPPEQASGKTATIKCDIYSMGILFYELLTGVLPFKGENAVEIALKHMKDPIPSVRRQNGSIHQSIENIILKSTAKNPKNRYADIKEMQKDLSLALDEDVKNQSRHQYKYSEQDFDDVKSSIPTIQKKKDDKKSDKTETEKKVAKEIKKPKKQKKLWLIGSLGAVFALLLISLLVVFIPPLIEKNKEINIPDVSGMTVEEARAVLENLGLSIEDETSKMVSSTYDAGLVIKTDPIANRKVKKGRIITIWESLGEETYTVDDFVGSNYIEIKTRLESAEGMVVEIIKKAVDDLENLDSQSILEQKPEAGTTLKKGDTITLYIPDVYEKYPDFVQDDWTIDEVKDFCEIYNLKCSYEEIETSGNYEVGEIVRQSRKAGSAIEKYSTLTITYVGSTTNDTDNPGEPSEP